VNSKKLLLVVVMLVGVLLMAGLASADTPVPGTHAPRCSQPFASPNVYRLVCQDAGSDLRDVVLYSDERLQYTVKMDEKTAVLTVQLPAHPVKFSWSIFDLAGNVTSGDFSK
jgi:hypothetical protein